MSESVMISVIVPVYNGERYLAECVDSILSQSYADLELILVDDGSVDSTAAICDKYAESDSRVKVIHQANAGVSAARNAGMDISRGKYITFVDGDDWLNRDALRHMVDRMESDPVEILLCNMVKKRPTGEKKYINFADSVCGLGGNVPLLALWGYCFRRDIIVRHNLRFIEGQAYSEDRIFLFQYAHYCSKIAYCSYFAYVYRLNIYSVVHDHNPEKRVWRSAQQLSAVIKLCEMADNEEFASYRKALLKDKKTLLKMVFYDMVYYKATPAEHRQVRAMFEEHIGNRWEYCYYMIWRGALAYYKKLSRLFRNTEARVYH